MKQIRLGKRRLKIVPLFAWYDLWIGAYWDRRNRALYVLPIPMLGVKIMTGHNDGCPYVGICHCGFDDNRTRGRHGIDEQDEK